MNKNQNDPDALAFLRSVDTPTLSNAIESFRLRPRQEGFTPSPIRCLFPEFGRMCGWAVTAQVETISLSNKTEGFRKLFELVDASPKPVIVAFQEIGHSPELSAHCGEGMTTAFQRLGAIGLVTDAAVRDIPEVRGLGFHYFARGSVASHANFRIVRAGVPIQVMGMTVETGNLLHGDENGLVQVPTECLGDLPEVVERIRQDEREMMEYVRGPQFDLETLLGRFFH